MLALYAVDQWPSFYAKGMKTWEIHFDKYCTSCSFERLPYRQKTGTAYAWVLSEAVTYKGGVVVSIEGRKLYHMIDEVLVAGKPAEPIVFKSERLACKFLGDTMLIYWIKKNYFALVCISDLETGRSELATSEIGENESQYILSKLSAK